jgi:citrate lyase alpha subunit
VRLFERRTVESEIARDLNERGIVTELRRGWTRGTVHQVLTNEKYIGNNVYNRISFKLKKKRVANSRLASSSPPLIERVEEGICFHFRVSSVT